MTNTTITSINSREILDSRGNPTIATQVQLKCGIIGEAAVPSGASTGKREALELRDGDASRYLGKGVLKAVANVKNIIAPAIEGMDATHQSEIDSRLIELDGTSSKSNLGANAMLSVSMASAKAAAGAADQELFEYLGQKDQYLLPVPLINILNGGSHADNNVDIQEFMILPLGAPNFTEAIRTAAEIFHHLKKAIQNKGYSSAVGDEGGFAPNLKANEEALDLIMESVVKAGYKPGGDVFLALDVAASEFFIDNKYVFKKSDGSVKTKEQMIDFYSSLIDAYPIISIEDGFAEDDWDGFVKLTERIGDRVQIVGDDLFATNPKRLSKGIEMKAANSILIKLNHGSPNLKETSS